MGNNTIHDNSKTMADTSFSERGQLGALLREVSMQSVAKYEALDADANRPSTDAVKIQLGAQGVNVCALV